MKAEREEEYFCCEIRGVLSRIGKSFLKNVNKSNGIFRSSRLLSFANIVKSYSNCRWIRCDSVRHSITLVRVHQCAHSSTMILSLYMRFYFYTCIDGDRYIGIASSKGVNVESKDEQTSRIVFHRDAVGAANKVNDRLEIYERYGIPL